MPVEPIPSNYPRLMAYIVPRDAAAAIEFYTSVFGATERGRIPGPNNTIGHAEFDLGGSVLMLADEPADRAMHPGYESPQGLGGTSFGFVLYVEDCDAAYQRALDLGATSESEPETKFYGDREARVRDPFGYIWSVMTHLEDVSPEEMATRAAERTTQAETTA